jgi:hypothetical protein
MAQRCAEGRGVMRRHRIVAALGLVAVLAAGAAPVMVLDAHSAPYEGPRLKK